MQSNEVNLSKDQKYFLPSLVIAALRGGSGKTVLTIGIIAALRDAGLNVSPFKKGPDYIDAGWLSLAAGRSCYNLDTFLVNEDIVLNTYLTKASNCDIAVIEGNRGLYDGIDLLGRTSTAEVAKLIKAPVILSIDCTKSTRTMAATVLGCIMFDPEIKIEGVILNKVAGSRHEAKLRTNIEHFCKIPVIGAVPKLGTSYFPERHMGLIPTFEHSWAKESIKKASLVAKKYIDLDAVRKIAFNYKDTFTSSKTLQNDDTAIKMSVFVPAKEELDIDVQPRKVLKELNLPDNLSNSNLIGNNQIDNKPLEIKLPEVKLPEVKLSEVKLSKVKISETKSIKLSSLDNGLTNNNLNKAKVKIGVIKDSAFQFYYPDNIEALENEGAQIVYISPLSEKKVPDVDAVYIGGGFPETHAKELVKNRSFREHLKLLAEKGMPIYAECGGLIFLGEELIIDNKKYPMVGLLPLVFGISKKPQGHGYTSIIVDGKNPFFDVGIKFKGHEFRYSYVIEYKGLDKDMVFDMKRGTGIINKRDGFTYKNTLASYNHLHAKGVVQWSKNMVKKARDNM